MKLINASIIGGEESSNCRGGARVATKSGTLLPMSDSQTDDNFIRILIDPTESERLQVDLQPGTKLVPQELKFAFVVNNATDWTLYADTLVPFERKRN